MPPRFVLPSILAGTLAGTALASVASSTAALGATLGLGIAGLLLYPRRASVVLAFIAAAVAVARVVLFASGPLLPPGTVVKFEGAVVGVRVEPYAVVRLDDPVALSGARLRLTPPADVELRPGDRVTGECRTGRLPGNLVRWRLQGTTGTCWRVALTRESGGVGFARVLAATRSWAAARIRFLYTEPGSDFLEGLLVGAPPNGSEELAAVLRRAGVSHLVAVSGYNLTILTGALGAVLFPLLGRGWGSVALAVMLTAFAGVSGFEPSVMRAGAMAGLQLVAYRVGRPAALPRLLALAVLVMVWAAPGLLLFDLGFQLSVAATAGIAFAARPMERRLTWLPDAFGVRSALATSLAALAATVPVLVLTVGRVSVVAPFTTALLTPFVPSAMGLGGLSLLLALVHPVLALPVAAVEQMLLAAMLATAGWFGRLPFAAVAVPLPALLGVAVAALLARPTRRRPLPVLPGWVHRA